MNGIGDILFVHFGEIPVKVVEQIDEKFIELWSAAENRPGGKSPEENKQSKLL